jgi:carbon monoxide dehydrogenase subunit G
LELTHSFTVPAGRDVAWGAFADVASVAQCFPGAQVTSAEGEGFEGTCKVKLGPIALTYAGAGRYLERDRAAGRMVLEAKGRDKRGNGTAGATVTLTLGDAGSGSTQVDVLTDLQITGKPAQFGRGVIQEVSDKLLEQFIGCLEERIGTSASAAEPPSSVAEPAPEPEGPPLSPTPAPAASSPSASPPPREQDALDLGTTVLPVLLRTYGPRIALVVALVVLWRVLRRRRR